MNKMFSDNAWQDFLLWMREDRKTAKKIASLLADIERNGNEGLGKPESLKGNLSGYWSRRISEKDRLIYRFDETTIYIAACKGHYGDK
nr:MAG TPA: YoeB-like toxin [Caudoviricetes sp.]DAW26346.1 MAG TPA: YoeB-like toxin [Caudoviricetes sp.]